MSRSVHIPSEALAAMVAQARFAYPEEACGLLAGVDGAVRMVYCLTNRDASPYRYTIEPREHFHAMRHAERHGWTIRGVFHSHPHAPAYPSPVDVRAAPDAEWVYVIVGHVATHPEVRAFEIEGGIPRESAVVVLGEGRWS